MQYALDEIRRHVTPNSVHILKDFDFNLQVSALMPRLISLVFHTKPFNCGLAWAFLVPQVCVSSCTISKMQQGFVQLQLQLVDPQQPATPKFVELEFTAEELDGFLNVLGEVHEVATTSIAVSEKLCAFLALA